jgi:hypothetical protein
MPVGSGFKTFATGDVLTAAEVNGYLMTQSVMYFATIAARDTAITSPFAGMVCFIDSNDANEGLYVYHGATGGWRKGPGWNAPWGWMANATSSAISTTTGTTELTIVSTAGFTAVSNRYYLLTGYINPYGSVGGDQFTLRLRNNSITGTVLAASTISVRDYSTNSISTVVSIAAGASNGIFLTVQRASGSGTLTSNHIASPAYITLTDIGPSGAPA